MDRCLTDHAAKLTAATGALGGTQRCNLPLRQSPENLLDTGLFALNTSGFTVDGQSVPSSDFQLNLVAAGNGDDIDLTFNATPEPGTTLLAGMGISPLLLARRRRVAA